MELLARDDPSFVGPHRLLARLGQGGMGQVFLARSAADALIAVKVIHPAYAGDTAFRRRFTHEVEATRRVRGDYTVTVLDSDTEAGLPWLATEYVRGHSLADTVDRHGPLGEDMVRSLGCGVARALQSVHAAAIVHRDVKPSNVLMAADGPRLVDFGVSRAAEASTLTASGQLVGSVGYMAPEQIEGREIDGRADIFALGAVLVYALTGNGPFGGGSAASLLYKVMHGTPEVPAIADPVLADTIHRCLAKDPAKRPSPADMAAALGPAPAAGFVPPEWLPNEAPVAPVRQPGAGTTTITSPARPDAPGMPGAVTPDRPPRTSSRKRLRLIVAALVALLCTAAVTYRFEPWPSANLGNGQTPNGASPGTSETTTSASATTPPPPPAPPTARPVVDNPQPGVTSPAVPTNLTTTPINTSTIRLKWSDNSSNENGFLINNTGSTREVGTNTTSYDWGGLSAGTYVCFAIAAFNSAGYSNYYPTSAPGWICASTPQPTSPPQAPPAAPSGLTGTAAVSTAIHLQWTDNSNNETGFEITNGTGASRTTTANTTVHDWTGLNPGTTMCFHIRAYNSGGSSAYSPASATVCATTPAPPAVPANVYAVGVSGSAIRVGWTYNWSSNSATNIEVTNDSGGSQTSDWGSAYDIWSFVPMGTTMCFHVRTYNNIGYSAYTPSSATVCATVQQLATPTGVTATAINSTTIRIQWTDNTSSEDSFWITNSQSASHIVGANITQHDWTGLSPGTNMCFHVAAVSNNYGGNSSPDSSTACATTPAS